MSHCCYNSTKKFFFDVAQEETSKLLDWTVSNRMELSVPKCGLLFNKKTSDSDKTENLNLKGESVPNLQNVRDLGVYFSQSLTWKMHIETKIKEATSVLWMVKRNVSPKTSMKTKLCLYKSFIIPIIAFGSTCWWASMKNSRLLENFRKHVTKWIINEYFSDYKSRLSQLNL